jgi:hypothetical protein
MKWSDNVWDFARKNPGLVVKEEHCVTDTQRECVAETGGSVWWCEACCCTSSSNRPCLCGLFTIVRSDGMEWGREDTWVWAGELFDNAMEAIESAQGLCAEYGELKIEQRGMGTYCYVR